MISPLIQSALSELALFILKKPSLVVWLILAVLFDVTPLALMKPARWLGKLRRFLRDDRITVTR